MALQITLGPKGGTARRRPPYFRTKKLGLLGSTHSLAYAPWTDASWTLAAHPCCRGACKREPDWYFDLHRPECFRVERKSWIPKYHTWLKKLQTPIFMQEDWPEIPMAVRYPKERIFGEFRKYFTNHCAYMIALAMTEGVTHIGLFGCQYSNATEHGVQRDSLTYWLGRFEQAGGTLVIPPAYNSVLASPPLLYGYESHDEHGQLVASYKLPPAVMRKTGKGDVRMELCPVSEAPLMALPTGVALRSFEDALAGRDQATAASGQTLALVGV